MSDLEEIRERLGHVEDIAEGRPGEALDELQAITADLDEGLAESHGRAHALVRNEDLAGAAQALGESAQVLQRTATLSLTVREEVRRRR